MPNLSKEPKDIQTSLIIPAFNEEPIISSTLQSLSAYIKKHKKSLGVTEVIIIAAGTDQTPKIAKTFKDNFDYMKIITPASRVGKGRDVRLGFQAASGQVQIFMDCDLATPIHHLKATVDSLKSGSDVVIGVRRLSKIHPGKLRTLFSIGSNLITRLLLFPKIKDTQCGYKGFTKDAAQKAFLRQRLNGWGFDMELLQLAKENKLKVTQQKIDDWHEEREEGLRGDGLMNAGFRTLADVLMVRIEAWGRFANRHYKLLLGGSMLATFVLALFLGHNQSVWFDEGYSIQLASRPVSELLKLTSVDAHPPLYYLLLKGWAGIFGYSELALRSMSALFGALSVGVMFLLVKKLFRLSSAVCMLPFLVVAPFLARYNFEIRMYSLLMFIGIVATMLLVKAKESNKLWHWLAYGLTVAVGMYTLYMSAVVWVAHGLYLLISTVRSEEKKPLLKQKFWLAYGFILLLFAPYIPTLVGQFQHSALPSITSRVTFAELTTILGFGTVYRSYWQVGAYQTLGILSFLVLLIKLISYNFSKADAKEKDSLRLLMMIFLVPILFFAVISLPPFRPYFMERYIAHFIVFGYALIGITLDSAWRRGKHVGSILLAVISTILLVLGIMQLRSIGNFNFQTMSKPSSEYLAQKVGECSDRQNITVVADEPGAYIDSSFYYRSCDLRFFSKDELGKYGGYVPLRFSSNRVDSTLDITAPRVFHLRWQSNSNPRFKISSDPRYELVSSTRFDKQLVDEYRLKPI